MQVTLQELADLLEGKVEGNPGYLISGLASLEQAGPDSVAFCSDRRHHSQLAQTRAGAVILSADDSPLFPGNRLVVATPYLAYARTATFFYPAPKIRPGRHPGAHVHPAAILSDSCRVEAGAVIQQGARIGERVYIGPLCSVGPEVEIGDDSRLESAVTLYSETRIGARCLISAGAVIGSPGFGQALDEQGRWARIPQVGRVVIGDDVDIGANTTIDRGALEDTVIGNGVKMDNQIQIAHNVRIGEHTALAGCVAIAGGAQIGCRCRLGGRVSVLGHLQIGDEVTVHAVSTVTRSLSGPGNYASTLPVQEVKKWRKTAGRVHRLEELAGKMNQLENELLKL